MSDILYFITAGEGQGVNFFANGNSRLPDASCFAVYINGKQVDQPYTSLTFKDGDEVAIARIDDETWYPFWKPGDPSQQKALNFVREVLEPLPPMRVNEKFEVPDFSALFQNCNRLLKIPAGFFKNNAGGKFFRSSFLGCRNLSEIPDGLFDDCPKALDFSWCFADCAALDHIPAGLFDKPIRAKKLFMAFAGCSGLAAIPEGLFDNLPAATDFSYCFAGCECLEQVPQGLLRKNGQVKTLAGMFRKCIGLKDFVLEIGAGDVQLCADFIPPQSGGALLVPQGSKTAKTFADAGIAGLKVEDLPC